MAKYRNKKNWDDNLSSQQNLGEFPDPLNNEPLDDKTENKNVRDGFFGVYDFLYKKFVDLTQNFNKTFLTSSDSGKVPVYKHNGGNGNQVQDWDTPTGNDYAYIYFNPNGFSEDKYNTFSTWSNLVTYAERLPDHVTKEIIFLANSTVDASLNAENVVITTHIDETDSSTPDKGIDVNFNAKVQTVKEISGAIRVSGNAGNLALAESAIIKDKVTTDSNNVISFENETTNSKYFLKDMVELEGFERTSGSYGKIYLSDNAAVNHTKLSGSNYAGIEFMSPGAHFSTLGLSEFPDDADENGIIDWSSRYRKTSIRIDGSNNIQDNFTFNKLIKWAPGNTSPASYTFTVSDTDATDDGNIGKVSMYHITGDGNTSIDFSNDIRRIDGINPPDVLENGVIYTLVLYYRNITGLSFTVEAAMYDKVVETSDVKLFFVDGNTPNTGDGSITNPFKTTDAAINAVIGDTGSRSSPDNPEVGILVRGAVYTTSTNHAINTVTWNMEPGASIKYNGNDFLFEVDDTIANNSNFECNILGSGIFEVENPASGNKGGIASVISNQDFNTPYRLNMAGEEIVSYDEGGDTGHGGSGNPVLKGISTVSGNGGTGHAMNFTGFRIISNLQLIALLDQTASTKEADDAPRMNFTQCSIAYGNDAVASGKSAIVVKHTRKLSFDNCTFTSDECDYLVKVEDGAHIGTISYNNCTFTTSAGSGLPKGYLLLDNASTGITIDASSFGSPQGLIGVHFLNTRQIGAAPTGGTVIEASSAIDGVMIGYCLFISDISSNIDFNVNIKDSDAANSFTNRTFTFPNVINSTVNIKETPAYADDADASSLKKGDVYQATGSNSTYPEGVLVIKQ